MNTISRFNFICALVWSALMYGASACEPSPLRIKVLIDSVSATAGAPIVFTSKRTLEVAGEKNPDNKELFLHDVRLTVNKNNWHIGDQKYALQELRIKSPDDQVTYKGKTYAGTFYCHPTKTGIDIVNKVPLEDYVTSVVRTEAWPNWPLESYKVQAVASRTYVIYQVQHAQKIKRHYHVMATNANQTYRGVHACEAIKDAVRETAGIFMSYNKQPILAMYDACCGGVQAWLDTRTIVKRAPYLARNDVCDFCAEFKIYSWKKELKTQTVIDRLKKTYPTLQTIKHIHQIFDTAGIVQEIKFEDKTRTYTLSGKAFHVMFPEVSSYMFTMKKQSGAICVKGRGFGHHIGLCQWGAYELVRRGWEYKDVLQFYYPGTTFMRICAKAKE